MTSLGREMNLYAGRTVVNLLVQGQRLISDYAPLYPYFKYSSSSTSTESIRRRAKFVKENNTGSVSAYPKLCMGSLLRTDRQQAKEPEPFMNSTFILEKERGDCNQ